MGALDRRRGRGNVEDVAVPPGGGGAAGGDPGLRTEVEGLRARLGHDPNDIAAFNRLAEIVRARAAEHIVDAPEGMEPVDPRRAADDAVWALAEEIAQSGRAWYPLVELARLSIDDDREISLRRLATAAERDPTGVALAQGVAVLREAGHAGDALGLGLGHWRPKEHDIEAGRQLVEAAVEAGRYGEARRHLEALSGHPDAEGVERLRTELDRRISRAERSAAPRTIPEGITRPGSGPGTHLY